NVAILLKGTGNPTIVVLDNDKEGRSIRGELEKQKVRVTEILMIPLTNHLQECELEDILDSEVLLMAFNKAFGTRLGIEFNFQEFREEQLRLRGRGEPHGWVDTVKSLIDQNFASTDSSRKKKRASDLFSKRILAEVAAEYVKCGVLEV